MIVGQLIKYLEKWAPPGIGWERDNVGLQVGSGGTKIKNILLSLELNNKVLSEAIKKNCNFIFTHHPLIFKPLKRIDLDKDPKSQLIKKAIEHNISVFTAHTNLDYTKDGVNFELARTLGLKNINFLKNHEANQYKLVVFVPENYLDKVSQAIFNAGGGIIGEYSKCSYRLKGEGTFEGSEDTNPAVGKKQKLETVDEVRLEVLIDAWKLNSVLKSMISVHPYEEPAYDVYVLKNKNVNYGEGTIGEFEKSMTRKDFFDHVSGKLKAKNFRYAKGKNNTIKKVAVCGGSGADLLNTAISAGADAFITADVKYHTFQDAEDKILLIDAGHYETEIHSLNAVKRKVEDFIKENNKNIKVYKFSGTTNPLSFYKL